MSGRVSASAAAALAAVGLAACGASAEDRVRSTLDDLSRATARKDYPTLCQKVFAKVLVERISSIGLPCEKAMSIGLGSRRRPRLRVLSVEVDGNQANAEVRSSARGEKPSVDTVHLVEEGGDWRVSALIEPGPPH
jgi:hypothetical protein